MRPNLLLRSAALALALIPVALHAQTSSQDFETIEFRCYDVPKLVRKQLSRYQIFHLSNLHSMDVFWYYDAANWAGAQAGNLAHEQGSGWGTLPAYSTHSFSNTELQLSNTPVGR